jgi:hypothetical protein
LYDCWFGSVVAERFAFRLDSYLVLVLALGYLGEWEVFSVVLCQHRTSFLATLPHFPGAEQDGTESPLVDDRLPTAQSSKANTSALLAPPPPTQPHELLDTRALSCAAGPV